MSRAARQLTPAPFPVPSRARGGRFSEAMAWIEALPPKASGALLVGPSEAPVGTILVESNRVCWGAAANMSRRLRDILRSRCGVTISEQNLDIVYARCRRERRPLGEALVASGLISSTQMRAAIKQHTVESLVAVDASLAPQVGELVEWPMTWVEHTGHGYNPQYTFAASEILAALGAHALDEAVGEILSDHLSLHVGRDCVGFAFRPSHPGQAVLVGFSGTVELPLQDVYELTVWAEAALAASAGFSPEVAHACARTAQGGAVAWRYEGEWCAALCLNTSALQVLSASLGNHSLPLVLATKTALVDRARRRLTPTNQQGE